MAFFSFLHSFFSFFIHFVHQSVFSSFLQNFHGVFLSPLVTTVISSSHMGVFDRSMSGTFVLKFCRYIGSAVESLFESVKSRHVFLAVCKNDCLIEYSDSFNRPYAYSRCIFDILNGSFCTLVIPVDFRLIISSKFVVCGLFLYNYLLVFLSPMHFLFQFL